MTWPVTRKLFNIAGPCDPARHYMVPAIPRLPEAARMVEDGLYFILHAARQSGKTTLVRGLTQEINVEGRFYALYCSLESAQGMTDMETGMNAVLLALRQALGWSVVDRLRGALDNFANPGGTIAISQALSRVCAALDKPLTVFFDEADCLSGQTLITFLRQLRDGYVNRDTAPFPWSLALVGMRDIRDFKAHIRPDRETLGSASPFNIVTEALTLRNFTPEEIGQLYQQHTDATGQVFEPGARERAYYWSEGQPWLVNALARQAVEKDLNRDYAQPVTAGHIDAAAETLMKRRDTHLDSLLERLKEPRVRRVIEPMLFGGPAEVDPLDDDTKFCLDLGLVTPAYYQAGRGYGLRPANPIYRDVMARTLNARTHDELPPTLANRWMDGQTLDMTELLKTFQQFWRENADAWIERYDYKEAAPHLILQAFLQRVVNGGAQIEREFALGRGRVDICVKYGKKAYPIEVKLAGRPKAESQEQILDYMAACGAKEGWVISFDRRPGRSWDEKISWSTEAQADGRIVHWVGG